MCSSGNLALQRPLLTGSTHVYAHPLKQHTLPSRHLLTGPHSVTQIPARPGLGHISTFGSTSLFFLRVEPVASSLKSVQTIDSNTTATVKRFMAQFTSSLDSVSIGMRFKLKDRDVFLSF